MSDPPVVKLSAYERAVNTLNRLTPEQDRIMSAALNELMAQRDEARAHHAAAVNVWEESQATLLMVQRERDEARRDAENETAHREACHEEYVRACAERDEWREKAQRRCGTCAYLTLPESAGKQWCERLDRFVSLQFGCADWRPALREVSAADKATRQRDEAIALLQEVREWHRCPWKHGASVEVIDLQLHAAWIARLDAALGGRDE